MPPIESRVSRGAGATRLLLACAALGSVAKVAAAHPLLLSGGEMVIDGEGVEIRLEVAGEDLLHWHGIEPEEDGEIARLGILDAAERHASLLEGVLMLRGADGNRLAGGCQLEATDWPAARSYSLGQLRELRARYHCRYTLPARTLFLVLRLRPNAFPMEIPWQIVLSVRGASQAHERVVRLTSRGNAEVVDLAPAEVRADACGACGAAPRFAELCAEVTVQEGRIDIGVSIPLPLVSTWLDVAVDDDDFLDPAHMESILQACRRLIEQGLSLRSNGPVEPPSIVVQVAPFAEEMPAASRINLWTGRLRAQLRFSVHDRAGAVLTWGLFNAGVLSARVVVRCGDRCTEHLVTTYEPTIALCEPGPELP